MAEHLVKIPCHIVFILKLYRKFLLGLFHCPAYLQLAPLPEELCSSGNAADYQRLIGIMGLSPLRGSLRAAHSKKRRKYHYTRHLHRQMCIRDRYVDVRLDRKRTVLEAYHNAMFPREAERLAAKKLSAREDHER